MSEKLSNEQNNPEMTSISRFYTLFNKQTILYKICVPQ